LRPVCTLSNGQKARAEAAILMCNNDMTVIDEWTSVVDRTVAKVMSHCIQKHTRKENKRIVLLSCHYDVLEWLNPDWVIDCNKQEYVDRRSVRLDFKRTERLQFDIRETTRNTWKYFSKYHYLTDTMPGGHTKIFGLWHDQNQIGFICYANYVPYRKSQRNQKMIMHANRIVIHPDYAGMGLGIMMTNESAKYLSKWYKIMCKFSSVPIYKSMKKSPFWKIVDVKRQIGATNVGGNMLRKSGFRENIKTYSFEFVG